MLVFDTETTGLLKPGATEMHLQPFLTEICILKFGEDFKITDKFESFVKPPVPVPDDIIEITGITNEMLKDAPEFPLIYDDLCDFVLGERTIYAHNCSFDISILENELARMECELKFPWPPEQICTVERSFAIRNKRLKLSVLYNIATGKEMKHAHRASVDCAALIECVKFLKEKNFL